MSEPRTAAERDLCDVLYHSEFHISREQANISGRLMYDAMLARGYRIEAEAAALPATSAGLDAAYSVIREIVDQADTYGQAGEGVRRAIERARQIEPTLASEAIAAAYAEGEHDG